MGRYKVKVHAQLCAVARKATSERGDRKREKIPGAVLRDTERDLHCPSLTGFNGETGAAPLISKTWRAALMWGD